MCVCARVYVCVCVRMCLYRRSCMFKFVCRMGNAIYIVSSCWDRKTREISQYLEKESLQPVFSKGSYGARRRQILQTPIGKSSPNTRSPPLSARQVDRDEHILVSARSIAIQKKAPLFRDNGEEEYLQNSKPMLSARKLNMDAILRMVDEDPAKSSSITQNSTPRGRH